MFACLGGQQFLLALATPYYSVACIVQVLSGCEVALDACLTNCWCSILLLYLAALRASLPLQPGVTTDTIDKAVHRMIIDNGAYPSPLNYGEPAYYWG